MGAKSGRQRKTPERTGKISGKFAQIPARIPTQFALSAAPAAPAAAAAAAAAATRSATRRSAPRVCKRAQPQVLVGDPGLSHQDTLHCRRRGRGDAAVRREHRVVMEEPRVS